jgi:hypothetical protein
MAVGMDDPSPSMFNESEGMSLIKGMAQTVDLEVYNMSVQGTAKKITKQVEGSPRAASPVSKKLPNASSSKVVFQRAEQVIARKGSSPNRLNAGG